MTPRRTAIPGRRYHAPAANNAPVPEPPRRSARDGGGNLLTRKQKASLAQLARKAFDHLDDLGLLTDVPGGSTSARFAAWRRAQQAEAVGHASLTTCSNDHFRPLRAHFNALLGRDDVAFQDHMRSGPGHTATDADDTREARERIKALIAQAVRDHQAAGGTIGPAYVLTIARRKFRRPRLSDFLDLSAGQLSQLLYTVCNRIAAKEGRGDTTQRNRSQRRRP